MLTKGGEDLVLQRGKGGLGLGFGDKVAGDGDVDDRAGRDVGWEENGGEFNLDELMLVSMLAHSREM